MNPETVVRETKAIWEQAIPDCLEANGRIDAGWELKMALHKALALERRGEFVAAIKQFAVVARKAGEGHPTAAMARDRAQQLQAKVQGESPEP